MSDQVANSPKNSRQGLEWVVLQDMQDKDDNSIVKQSLQISVELYNNSLNGCYANLMSGSKIKQLEGLMKKKCLLLEPDASALRLAKFLSLHQKELLSYRLPRFNA